MFNCYEDLRSWDLFGGSFEEFCPDDKVEDNESEEEKKNIRFEIREINSYASKHVNLREKYFSINMYRKKPLEGIYYTVKETVYKEIYKLLSESSFIKDYYDKDILEVIKELNKLIFSKFEVDNDYFINNMYNLKLEI